MPTNSTTVAAPKYTVWSGGRTYHGSARKVLQAIQNDARSDSAIKKMSLRQYAEALVGDAAFFVPEKALRFLKKQAYESIYDQALQYLAAMVSGGVRILSKT